MESIIKKLYYGEISPCNKPAPKTERSIDNRNIIQKTEEQILKQFPDCEALLTKYSEALFVETQIECEADFVRGFKIGVMLLIDVMSKD